VASAIASATDAAGEGTARSFYGAQDLGVHGVRDVQYTVALKQFFEFSPDWSLLWGLSAAVGPNASGHGNETDVYGTDVYLKWRPITAGGHTHLALQAEWLYRRRQVPNDLLSDANGYAQLVWHFAARWGTAARWEHGTPAYDDDGRRTTDPLDPDWTKTRQRASVNLTFWPSEFSRLRLQASRDDAGWRPKAIWAAFLAAEFTIGAHGAHTF
jgi:hypothetical protein